MPSQVPDFNSPIDVLPKSFPNFKGIGTLPPKIFGCTSFIHIPKQSRDKLNPRALRCVFLGYSFTQQRIDWLLANKFFLCQTHEESIDHILLHCVKVRVCCGNFCSLPFWYLLGDAILRQKDFVRLT